MKLTSEMIKEKAKDLGIDVIGIGSIDRYKNAPTLMNPKTYFPEAKSVIVIGMRIPRGSYRGIEEGTHWHNYSFYAYNRLNTIFRPRLTYELACFIEDHGWEAVPHYPAVPERSPSHAPVAPGKVPHDVACSVRLLGVGAGVGEMGHSKVFLTKKFGPRVRLGSIFTDAELEPDPIIEPGTICNKCGRCVKDCPGNAIPPVKDEDKKITVEIGDKKISWGDVHMGRCTLTHHGLNNTISPFLKKDFPNLEFDVANSDITEEEAYRLTYPLGLGTWGNNFYEENGGNIIKYYKYILNHCGYFALCGAKGCIRACMDSLEKSGRIENIFKNNFYRKKSWSVPVEREGEKIGVINPFREKALDELYPSIRKGEQEKSKFK
jgi:epoxyqueuosine reductase